MIFKTGDRVWFTTKDYASWNEFELMISHFVDNEHVMLEVVGNGSPYLLKAAIKDLTTQMAHGRFNFIIQEKIKDANEEIYNNAPNLMEQAERAFKYTEENGYTTDMIMQELYGPQCECGAEKVGIDKHSDWCAKYGGE